MTAAKRALRDADITAIAWLSAPTLRPDGRAAAVVESRLNEATGQLESQLIVIDFDLVGDDTPRAMQVVPWHGRWDRSGRRIAVARDVDGIIEPWLVDPADGRAAPLTRERSSYAQTGPASWSADDEWLAFPARSARADHDCLHLVHIASGRVVEHAVPTGGAGAGAWSPTGSRFAWVVESGASRGASLWVSDPEVGDRGCLVSGLGSIASPAWSPDGNQIAYIAIESMADQAANHVLEVVPAVGGPRVQVGDELDVSFGQRVQSDDPRGYDEPTLRWPVGRRGLLATYSSHGETRLAWVGTDGCTDIVAGKQVVLDFDCTADGKTIAYISSDPYSPGELFVADEEGTRQLTDRNAGWRSQVELADVRTHVTSASGAEVEAWVYRSTAAGRSEVGPAIVAIHGGPHWPAGWRFSFEYQRHAALGRTVVVGNPRGSQGYGAAFARANQGDWGGCDADDIAEIVNLVRRLDGVDGDRIAVTGVSYGGYLACLVAARSDQIAAVVGENLLTDLARYVQANADTGVAEYAAVEFGGLPADRPEFYAERSPVTHASTFSAPVLLVHGELDDNCPIEQSELLLAALRDHGKHGSLLRIPDESHAMVIEGSLPHRLLRWRTIDQFLDTSLAPVRSGSGQPPPR